MVDPVGHLLWQEAHPLLGQSFHVWAAGHWKVLPCVELKPASLRFLSVSPGSSLGSRKDYSLLYVSVLQIFEDINHVLPSKAVISTALFTG